VWLLIVTVALVGLMALVWQFRRAKGAHHPDRGPSRTGRVSRRGGEDGTTTALPPDPGDARPAGPDAEAMGVPEPGQPGLAGDDAGRQTDRSSRHER
jgi:hypothetical protein